MISSSPPPNAQMSGTPPSCLGRVPREVAPAATSTVKCTGREEVAGVCLDCDVGLDDVLLVADTP